MAPPGTKAIIYDDADSRALSAPHGLDAWLLGPSKDHYHCHIYYIPETTGYCVSGSADLFPQHCIAPPFSNETHVNELSEEIQDTLTKLTRRERTLKTLRTLATHLDAFVSGTPLPRSPARNQPPEEQRVVPLQQTEEQRVVTFQEPPLQ